MGRAYIIYLLSLIKQRLKKQLYEEDWNALLLCSKQISPQNSCFILGEWVENPAGVECSQSDAGLHSEHFKRSVCTRSSVVAVSPRHHCSACVFCESRMCVEHRGTTTCHKTHSAVERGAVMPCLQLQFSMFTVHVCNISLVGSRVTQYWSCDIFLFNFELYRPLISHRNSVSQLLCAFNSSRSQN